MAQGEKENESREANAQASAETPKAEPQQLQDDLHVKESKKQVQTQVSSPLGTQEKRIDTPRDLDSESENPVERDPEGHSIAMAKADESAVASGSANQPGDTAQSAEEGVSELKHPEDEEDAAVSVADNTDREQKDTIMQDQPESETETEVQDDDGERIIQGDVDEADSSAIHEKSDGENCEIDSVIQQEHGESLDEAKPNAMDSNASTQSETVEIIQTPTVVQGSDMDLQTFDLTSESVQEHCPSLEEEHKESTDHGAKQRVSMDEKHSQGLAEAHAVCIESSDPASENVDEQQRDIDLEDKTPATDVEQAVMPLLDESGDQVMNEDEQARDYEDDVVSEAETVEPEDDEDLVQAKAAELRELAKPLDHGKTGDKDIDKVLDAHEDTDMADAESMPEGEQWFSEEDISTEGYAIAIPTVRDEEVLETTPTKLSGLKRKRPTSEPYTGEVVEISSDEEKTSKYGGSNSSSSSSNSSSSGSSSSNSSSSSSGSDSSDAENQSPPKRQVPIPVSQKRVSRGPARPAISLDDYKIFKDVDPLMRDTPILKGKYTVHKTKYARFTGVWGFSTEDFDHPERVSKFEYTTRKLQGRRENDRRPVSGRYTGYFNFRQFGGKIVRIQESVVELDFRKIRPPESLPSGSDELIEADLSEEDSDAEGGDAQYVVYGKGKNRFGRFLIHGYLNPADGRLVVRRKYLE